MKQRFNSIEAVIGDLRQGKMVIVVDDADRENEGDLIMGAQFVTPETVVRWRIAKASASSGGGSLAVAAAVLIFAPRCGT